MRFGAHIVLRNLTLTFVALTSINAYSADLLIWPIDARVEPPKAVAKDANWIKYISAKAEAESIAINLPEHYGVGDLFYPQLLSGADEVQLLRQSAIGTGAEAAMSIRLNADGINWTLVDLDGSKTLRTAVTSDGLALGVNWLKLQVPAIASPPKSVGPIIDDLNPPAGVTSVTREEVVVAPVDTVKPQVTERSIATTTLGNNNQEEGVIAVNEVAPVVDEVADRSKVVDAQSVEPRIEEPKQAVKSVRETSNATGVEYNAPGLEVTVAGINTFADLMQVSGQIRDLEPVKFAYVSKMRGNQISLVVGSDLDVATLSSLLIDLPWLEPTGIDAYRFLTQQNEEPANLEDLMAMPIESQTELLEVQGLDAELGNDALIIQEVAQ